jgi:hypothetical protein
MPNRKKTKTTRQQRIDARVKKKIKSGKKMMGYPVGYKSPSPTKPKPRSMRRGNK